MPPIEDDVSGQVDDFGAEPLDDLRGQLQTKKENVSDQDVFSLGKWVLAVCAIFFLIVGAYRVETYERSPYNSGVEEVWKYASTYLSNIITLILGFYFGNKQNK